MVRRRIPGRSVSHGRLRIREGQPADVSFVRELSRQVFDQFGDYGEFLPSYLEHPSVFTVIAEEDGALVGFLMLALVASSRPMPWEGEMATLEEEALDAEILAIAVGPEHQSRGTGAQLMEYAVRCAQGWRQVVEVRSLQLNVADTNERGQRFFVQMGFVEVDAHDGVYPRGQRSIRMARRLVE